MWLPLPGKGDKKARMRIYTEDWQTITSLVHMSKGMINATGDAYGFNFYKEAIKRRNDPNYPQLTRMQNSLDKLIDFSLELWKARI